MEIWRSTDEIPELAEGSAVTVGTFDGVHEGHRSLISKAVAAAQGTGLRSVVVTFEPHPMAVIVPDRAPLMLSTLQHRLHLLEDIGVDAVLVMDFTKELADESAEDFVQRVLVDSLNAKQVVVGENFRYGYMAKGDVALLTSIGESAGFEVEALSLIGAGSPVSSTAVRNLLKSGDVLAAGELLHRPHRVEGEVVHGDHRGRELGYPTANLSLPANTAIPEDGVYAGFLVIDAYGDPYGYPAAISVGTNPTFDGTERRVEAYAIGETDLDLYGKQVAVDFLARIRGQERFDSLEDLIVQMADDVEKTLDILPRPA